MDSSLYLLPFFNGPEFRFVAWNIWNIAGLLIVWCLGRYPELIVYQRPELDLLPTRIVTDLMKLTNITVRVNVN